MQNKELKFIEIIKNTLSNSSYLGDDCAYLADLNCCVSADTLAEGVHFNFDFITPYILAKKALKVNISDVLASGAKPLYATICLSGKLDENFISEFYRGIDECALEFGIKIIGGDLTGGEKISISICIIGDTKGLNISSRKNAKEGYILALCGNFGASARGLKMLLEDKKAQNDFTRAHLEPVLQTECAQKIALGAKEPYAMTDSSDGLVNALEWFKKESGTGFELYYDKIPKLKGTKYSEVLFGGEDYSLVCALSKDDFKRIGCSSLIPVGQVIKEKKILIDNIEIEEIRNKDIYKGEEFLHFD